jgi:hypothetical protein
LLVNDALCMLKKLRDVDTWDAGVYICFIKCFIRSH